VGLLSNLRSVIRFERAPAWPAGPVSTGSVPPARPVDQALAWLGFDMVRTMTLLGAPDVTALHRGLLDLADA